MPILLYATRPMYGRHSCLPLVPICALFAALVVNSPPPQQHFILSQCGKPHWDYGGFGETRPTQ